MRPYATPINSNGRVCTVCKQFKLWDEFYTFQRGDRVCRRSQCKACRNPQANTRQEVDVPPEPRLTFGPYYRASGYAPQSWRDA